MSGRPKAELVLSEAEREQLTALTMRRKTAQALALRARIVLSCAEGIDNRTVAAKLRVTQQTVSKWRGRYVIQRLDGLLSNHEKPLLHSDQGWQYQMSAYRRMLEQRGLTQSMSRRANCHDNAAMESFFGTLKSEFFRLNTFESIDALKAGIKQYIHYYNHKRIKLKLKGLSPVMYRTQPSTA
jgi:transposase InsO family protein